jgi:hypothetical protein
MLQDTVPLTGEQHPKDAPTTTINMGANRVFRPDNTTPYARSQITSSKQVLCLLHIFFAGRWLGHTNNQRWTYPYGKVGQLPQLLPE